MVEMQSKIDYNIHLIACKAAGYLYERRGCLTEGT